MYKKAMDQTMVTMHINCRKLIGLEKCKHARTLSYASKDAMKSCPAPNEGALYACSDTSAHELELPALPNIPIKATVFVSSKNISSLFLISALISVFTKAVVENKTWVGPLKLLDSIGPLLNMDC